ncbi:T9SS type B sorting domain-containing protein [Tellurirhabdus bombi]|uniref:T9SS type B sorting domain-containing protein n=1 Tax=Tellurirhabdus bombi TaxID=2907205 RepID=UPI001F2893B2|nr:gliding motility-associated C-terminal domain-containing protein [Tellurirhabdus bombi]
MKQLYFLLYFLAIGLLPQELHAQATKRFNVWYFGSYAGLDFNGGGAQQIPDNSRLYQIEGCASICDENGRLLFYTDGIKIWTREFQTDGKHKDMPNATNLGGNSSSTQSALIVPHPSDRNLYYVFSTAVEGKGSLQYATVDMCLNNGYGAVKEKNKVLHNPVAEKVTAIPKADKKGYWIISHEAGSDKFLVFSLDAGGVNPTPTVYSIGSNYTIAHQRGCIGTLKAAPNGKKLAVAVSYPGIIELFDFDDATGRIYNAVTVASNKEDIYAVEFSPDGRLLYATSAFSAQPYSLYQFNISQNPASEALIATRSGYDPFGTLQIGPSGDKIYVALNNKNTLGVINNPNAVGTACNFTENGPSLGSKRSLLGLPNVINVLPAPQTNNKPEVTIKVTRGSAGCNEVTLEAVITNSGATKFKYQWSANGIVVNGATQATYKVPGPGNYIVKVTEDEPCRNESAQSPEEKVEAANGSTPEVTIETRPGGGCSGTMLEAVIKKSLATKFKYEWFVNGKPINGANQATLKATDQGNYTVKITEDEPCQNASAQGSLANLTPISSLTVNAAATPAGCGHFVLAANAGLNRIEWSGPGISGNRVSKDTLHVYGQSGTVLYKLKITDPTDAGCIAEQSLPVTFNRLADYDYGTPPAPACGSVVLTAKPTGGWDQFAWLLPDGTRVAGPTVTARTSGTFTVVAQSTTTGCTSRDQVAVTVSGGPTLNIVQQNPSVCFDRGEVAVLDAGLGAGWQYEWRALGQPTLLGTGQTLTVSRNGEYEVRVSDGTCSTTGSLRVVQNCPPTNPESRQVFIPEVFTPNGDGINDRFELKGNYVTRFEMQVYTRWGSVVFSLTGTDLESAKNNFWDGTYRGEAAPLGPYTYRISISQTFPDGSEHSFRKQGTVMVLR